ncbi:6761_t:CDS:2 [Funneliformis geosporum]|nr:6761_t:CDS:2 [Funneliformis geosporum]
MSPFPSVKHGTTLAVQICLGKRPDLGKIKIPQLLENLIKQCWDADPLKRPTASEIEAEEYNKTLPEEVRFPKYEVHSQNTYTKLLQKTTEQERVEDQELEELDVNDFNLDELNIKEEFINNEDN